MLDMSLAPSAIVGGTSIIEGSRLTVMSDQGQGRKRSSVLSAPKLSTHKGRRGSVGVLMPETGDVTHELPKKPIPIKSALKPEIGARIRTEAHYL
jgi:hypothetical protein